MIDTKARKPLHVSIDGTAGPYIRVPLSQLSDVREVLDSHQIRYRVEENALSLDGAPAIAVIDLGRGADAAAVQTILDGVH